MIELYNDTETPKDSLETVLFRIADIVADLLCPFVYAGTFAWLYIKDKIEDLFL